MFLLMLGVYFIYMYIASRELNKLPYSKYRVPNLSLKFQVSAALHLASNNVAWLGHP
jgi:hypothetical protein